MTFDLYADVSSLDVNSVQFLIGSNLFLLRRLLLLFFIRQLHLEQSSSDESDESDE